MVATRKLEIQIVGDDVSGSRTFGRIGDEADRTESRMSKWSTKIAGLIGAAFAVDAIVDWGATLINAAEEAQAVGRQTEAVLTSMGGAANMTADDIAELAEKISLKTGLDDEMIQSGENVLLTFGNIRNEVGESNDVFTRATKVATDMSVAMGTDLQSSVVQVGKALNDPIAGLSALTRAGVQFTDEQKAMIEQLVVSGDTLGAQKVILQELERQFGGSAEAQATASDKLKVAWDNIVEQLGTALLPVFEKVATWLAETLPGAIDTALVWLKDNEDAVKNLAIAFGVILVGALVVYTVQALIAAAATVAATWPILVALGIVLLLAAALYYAYQNWGWFRTGADSAIQSVTNILNAIKMLIGGVDRAIDSFRRLADAISDLPGVNNPFDMGFPGKSTGSVKRFDSGGTLRPGINVVDNQTGKPEPLVPPDLLVGRGGGDIHVNVIVQGSMLGTQRELVAAVNEGLAKGYRLQSQGRGL